MGNLKPFITNEAPSVDSAKIRIPIRQVTILNPSIQEGHWMKVHSTTGEIAPDDWKTNAYHHKEIGYSTRYAIEDQVSGDKQVYTYMTIGINSKMLRFRYQEGITMDTLPLLLEEINRQGHVQIDMEALLHAQMTDVDFKSDFYSSEPAMKQIFKFLESITKPFPEAGKGVRVFNQKDNHGIQWNDRKTNSIKTAPYCKIYSKTKDLQSKSRDFTGEYLQGIDVSGVYRIESTLKNRKHFSSYGVDDTTVKGILSLPSDKVTEMIQHILKVNIKEEEPKAQRKASGMNWQSQERLGIITTFLEMGQDIESITGHFTKYVSEKKNRKYIRKQVQELYFYLLDNDTVEGVSQAKKQEIKDRITEYNRVISDVLGL